MDFNTTNQPRHINLGSKEERLFWCQQLKCQEQDLIDAVMVIGSSVQAVDDYLILNRKKTDD